MSLYVFLKKMSGITTNEEILYGNHKIGNKRPMCDCHQSEIQCAKVYESPKDIFLQKQKQK